jgi:Bacterial PH domain
MSEEPAERADAAETARRYEGALGVGKPTAETIKIPVTPHSQREHKSAFGGRAQDHVHTDHHDGEIPAEVRRYLIAGEEHAIVMHYHPAKLAGQATALLGGLAAAIILNGWLYYHHQATPVPVHVIWLGWLALAVWYAAHAVGYHYSWIIVTPVRILTVSGVLSRHIDPLPMKRIRDLQLDRDLWGRMLGYGTLRTESLATDHALSEIRFVPGPDRVYAAIWGILLPKKGVSLMPDEVS